MLEHASFQTSQSAELMQVYWAQVAEAATPGLDDVRRREMNNAMRQQRTGWTAELADALLKALVAQETSGKAWQAWFWFNHFNVSAEKSHMGAVLQDYVSTALAGQLGGRFVDVLQAATLHPAMLMYLDNGANRRARGNENHARELLELHTLGVRGGYGQADVTAVARVMTGWAVALNGPLERMGQAVFNAQQHDTTVQQVLGRAVGAQAVPGAAVVSALPGLLAQLADEPATARHVARRLCSWWLPDQAVTPATVAQLAAVYRNTGGELAALWAAAQGLRAAAPAPRLKDPLRYVTSAVRALTHGAPLANAQPLRRWLQLLGQPMFMRASPDGYPLSEAAWLSSGQLAMRVELARDMVVTLPRLLVAPVAEAAGRKALAPLALPPLPDVQAASAATRAVLAQSESLEQAWALWLASPEFMHA